jgi:hypothetical protein
MSIEIRLSGLTAILAAGIWMLTEIMEIVSGGFSPVQLSLTLVAFVMLPFGVLGFHAAQASKGGWMSLIGAVCFAGAFILWSGVTMLDVVLKTKTEMEIIGGGDIEKIIFWIASVLTVVGSTVFGIAALRVDVFPRWTGIALILAAVFFLVLSLFQVPMVVWNIINVVTCVALIRMGWVLWLRPVESTAASGALGFRRSPG